MKHLYTSLLVLLSFSPAAAQSTLTFTPLAALPAGGRYGMGYAQDNDGFYMAGGGGTASAFTSEVFRYSISANSWTQVFGAAPLPPQRWASAVIIDPNPATGKLVVLGGVTPTALTPVTTLQSIPLNGGPATTTPNSTPAATTGTAAWNGLIYAFGGQLLGGVFTNQLRAFNPATNAWTDLAPMPDARQTYGAAVNGKLYAVGGYNGLVNSAQIHAYDIATNTWQLAATLPTTVSNQAMAVQGEWIWMVGDFTNQSYLAAYNTRTGQLRTFTSNLPPRRNAAAIIRNNQLYVWGGNTASSNASTLADMWQANLAGVLASTPAAPAAILSAYPNPSAAGEFTLSLPTGTHAVEVRDALGRLVLTQPLPAGTDQYQLQLGSQPAGLYLAQLRTDRGLGAPYKLLRL
ncbi:Kelch repeat-containing protein [Hymenobacter lucidus]|uniref:T9SS type A sorting domain-containing protein n=1 Tax=Hymenobacter lucidus TaxID=2880930 RepID=A0ABS8AR22_9BACT|nr:kelch repeat-containing protein [Hymenobacter lucidus]MCB2408048.1 T9SS type A sorting domain-containing protein [Hymenobacter lucidus]